MTVTLTKSNGDTYTEVLFYRRTTLNDGVVATTTTSTSTLSLALGGSTAETPGLSNSIAPSTSSAAAKTITTTKGADKTVVEVVFPSSTEVIKTILSGSSKTGNKGNNALGSQGSQSLSTGSIAGIAVGILVVLVVIVALLVLLLMRRRRTEKIPEVASEEPKSPERKTVAPTRGSRKGNVLPTWKSELSGEPHRVELDASKERKDTEMSVARSPTELDSNAIAFVERSEVADNESRSHAVTKLEQEAVDSSKPPPIPYASKPRF